MKKNKAAPILVEVRASPWRRMITKAAILFSALILWQGLVRRPTPPAYGAALHAVVGSNAASSADTIRLATFNIAGGVSPVDNHLNLARTAKYLERFDLIGLEEVHGASLFDTRDQAEILGESLHMPWLFAASETRWWRDSFGNGVLCSLPVAGWQRLPISSSLASSNRSMLRLIATWHAHPITVIITHLDRHEDHDIELGAVIAAFYNAPAPAILLGDLNTDTTDKQLAKVRQDAAVTDCLTQSLGDKVPPINNDWIFARGLHCQSAGLSDNDASDHKLAWAELSGVP